MHLTFAAFDAYPLLDPRMRGGIGGAEVRAITFARGLHEYHDAHVSVLVHDRPELPSTIDGLNVSGYRKPRLGAIAKLGRSIVKRLSQRPNGNTFFHALQSDVVLCMGVRNDTASIVRSCQESGKKCVVLLTSDRNIDDAMRRGRQDRGIYGELGHLCRFVLEQADLVIAQSPYQLDMLRKKLGITGRLIRNPIDLTTYAEAKQSSPDPTMLWIGRADTYSKRADLCIELARRCPELRFKMVMNNHDQQTFGQLASAAPRNVQIVEQVPFSHIESLYADACLMINTSAAEGFPNSFPSGGQVWQADCFAGRGSGRHVV